MQWKLTEETPTTRKYVQEKTGTELETHIIYTDKTGANWWGFKDLFAIPYIRIAYSKKIADLFTTGLALADIKKWCAEQKKILKSNDPEKYEKAYAQVLDIEATAESTANPTKQHLALCAVYVLAQNERIDYFDMAQVGKKLELWALDTDATSFFLNWHTVHMEKSFQNLSNISRIASTNQIQPGPQ